MMLSHVGKLSTLLAGRAAKIDEKIQRRDFQEG
jgi:hypothetical protein